jgi:RHS repeat-associated protein
MRTPSGVVWLANDPHGTSIAAITAAAPQTAALRRQTPYGAPRGSSGTWPASMVRGFVGGAMDGTGLTHLGAREYDPMLGRFISADPVFDSSDPASMNGYAYAANDPISSSDPTGLRRLDEENPRGDNGNKWSMDHNDACKEWANRIREHYIANPPTNARKGRPFVPDVTIDPDQRARNAIAGTSTGKNPDDDGFADIICWNCKPGTILVWEVKQADGPAEQRGPTDLKRYVDGLRGDKDRNQGKKVEPGPYIPGTKHFSSRQPDGGEVTVFASDETDAVGVVLYRKDKRKEDTQAKTETNGEQEGAGEERRDPPYQPPFPTGSDGDKKREQSSTSSQPLISEQTKQTVGTAAMVVAVGLVVFLLLPVIVVGAVVACPAGAC